MVLPPDEDAIPFKNNSVYTNAVASLSIRLASAVSCITQKVVPQTWLDVASNLHFPFDNVSQIHLEYEDFDPSQSLRYPVDLSPYASTRRRRFRKCEYQEIPRHALTKSWQVHPLA